MKMIIKSGRLLNPATNTDDILDIALEEGKVTGIAPHIPPDSSSLLLDASGCYVMPGLIDLHVHLRDPGQTHKETLRTGGMAAAKGGLTTIVAMANTRPVVDSPEIYEDIMNRALSESPVHIIQAATLTRGMEGKVLSPVKDLIASGCRAFSEDGKSVMDPLTFSLALKELSKYDVPVLDHCEDPLLKNGGVMHEGSVSRRLGLPGIPAASEDIIAARDIILAADAGARLHLCHCSTSGVVTILRHARALGIPVSAEVCPHHFSLSQEDIPGDDANYKMAPPLRGTSDVKALIEGLADGTIDVISSDHAPHSAREKTGGFLAAPFGISGLETSVALTLTYLVRPGIITPLQMAEKMSFNPAKILKIPKGDISPGCDGDLTIIDPSSPFTVDKESFVSLGHNTPFHGKRLYGTIKATICGGRIVYPFTSLSQPLSENSRL